MGSQRSSNNSPQRRAKKSGAKKARSAKSGSAKGRTAKKKASPKKASAKKASPKKSSQKKGGAKRAPKKRDSKKPSSPGRLKRVLKWGAWAVLIAVALFVFASVGGVATYRFVNPPVTPLMLLRSWTAEDDGAIHKQWRDFEAISPHLAVAVLAGEDQRFFEHNGFDFVEIENAVEAYRQGHGLRGASTITQQVAKNVFLLPTRSLARKAVEAYFALLVEAFWSKERILEVYLNVAELGNGIYGAEAASRHWYGKPASELTRKEAASIAAILPNPLERSPTEPAASVARRRDWILAQMHNLGGTRFLDR